MLGVAKVKLKCLGHLRLAVHRKITWANNGCEKEIKKAKTQAPKWITELKKELKQFRLDPLYDKRPISGKSNAH